MGPHLDDAESRARIDGAREELTISLEELRDVARGLHPAVLSGHGLKVALESLAAGSTVPVRLTVSVDGRLDESLEVAAFYVVSEGLANVGKHAQAAGATVNVGRSNGQLVVEVVDDGVGRCRPRPRFRHPRTRRPRRGTGRAAPDLDAAGRRDPRPGGAAMRVALAEDSVLLREGVASVLEDAGFDVVAKCGDADELLRKIGGLNLDIAVVDIRLPPTHSDEGLQAALEIRANHPSVGVLVLSQYVELGLAITLLSDSAEGTGYLLKDRIGDVEEFLDAVRRVAAGGSALDPIIVSTLLARQRPDDPLAELTVREREVLELMAAGTSNQGIADKLVINIRSVEKYVSSIFGKLDLPSTGSESRRVLAVLTFLGT